MVKRIGSAVPAGHGGASKDSWSQTSEPLAISMAKGTYSLSKGRIRFNCLSLATSITITFTLPKLIHSANQDLTCNLAPSTNFEGPGTLSLPGGSWPALLGVTGSPVQLSGKQSQACRV